MLTAYRNEFTTKPDTFVDLGTGYWHYNYDIQPRTVQVPTYIAQTDEEETLFEDLTWYSCIQVRMGSKPTYKDCVKAIIRRYIDEDAEFDLINSYNADLINMLDNPDYKEYLALVEEVKGKVKADFNMPSVMRSIKPLPDDLRKFASLLINTVDIDDDTALLLKSLYPGWLQGLEYKTGMRLKYDGKLFKVMSDHVSDVLPGDLDSEILELNMVDTPYPFTGNMALYLGRYYILDGVTYQCIKSSGLLSELSEEYVQKLD